MRILVTGGAGFIGTNLIKRLISEGHEVHSIDNYTTGDTSNHQKGCKYWGLDVRTINGYDFINPDVVFHLAALARIQPSFQNPKEYFRVNADGTLNVADWCNRKGVPLIYAGSSSSYSGKFSNPYTFSKDIGEEILELYATLGLKYSIVRFYNVYGPHQLLEGDYTTLIGRWIHNIENGKPCVIYGTGNKMRDFTHVDDVIDGLILLMEQEKYGVDYDLCKGELVSINEVAQMFGITPIYEEDKKGEAQCSEKINANSDSLGWEPKKSLVHYIKEKEWKK